MLALPTVASREAWLCRSQTTCAIAFISPGHPEALDMFWTIAPSLGSLPAEEPYLASQSRFGAFTSSMIILLSSPMSPFWSGTRKVIV